MGSDMASPQVENGFTRIAHELLEQICRRDFTKRQLCLLLAIIRETYGYNRKVAPLTISYLARATGLDTENTRKAFAELVAARCVIATEGVAGPQKDYDLWAVTDRCGSPVKTTGPVKTTDGQNNRLIRSKQPDNPGQNNRESPVKTTGTTHLEPAIDAASQEPKEKKDMKERKKSPYPPTGEVEGFAEFYVEYPGARKSRSRDLAAYTKALRRKGVTPALLLERVRAQKGTHPDWCNAERMANACSPTVWLNQARWEWEAPSSAPALPAGVTIPESIQNEPWAPYVAPYIQISPAGKPCITAGTIGSYATKVGVMGRDAETAQIIYSEQGARAAAAWVWERRAR